MKSYKLELTEPEARLLTLGYVAGEHVYRGLPVPASNIIYAMEVWGSRNALADKLTAVADWGIKVVTADGGEG